IKLKKNLNGVLLVPSFRHPFKSDHAEASFEDRLEMAQLAVADQQCLIVSDIERELDLPGYTVETVRALKRTFSETEFCFILGADNVGQMKEWRDPEGIIAEVVVIAGTRPGFEPTGGDGLADRIEYVETSAVAASSTIIRAAFHSGEITEKVAGLLDPKVLAYINRRRLYR
ncbi:MAG TPA: nicotinate-nicotinamide nucleotide adenylyltransferase, partial [candidate division Zixibacteria bacterium]|nr:nicotinate-nicotinamide nucleotide adenylyltransferase [candidate division Zixibacteria bacterium]